MEEAHKRLDELEIHRGENVMLGHTGTKLGTVQDLVLDEGELAGVVIRPEGFFAASQDVLLQIRFLGRSDDLALFAHLTEADLARLTPFHPGGTGVGTGASARGSRRLRLERASGAAPMGGFRSASASASGAM